MKVKILFLLLFSQFAYSQLWVNSMDDAKKLAKATKKFILIDFNATWCKPCKQMESEFWNNSKHKSTLDKFIIVPVDIDFNKDIAGFYSVNSIPNVKLIDIEGNVIHEALGFENGETSKKEFEGFPENSENLYEALVFKDKKNPTDEELLNLASVYQVLLQKSNKFAKRDFLVLSNNFFNKCLKKTKDNNFKEIAELGKSFNFVLTDSNSKAIKNIDVAKISQENRSYAHYILARAHYQDSNKAEAEKNVAEIEKLNDENWLPATKALKAKYNQ